MLGLKQIAKCSRYQINEYGKIDILINNAGISDPIPALEEDLDQFKGLSK